MWDKDTISVSSWYKGQINATDGNGNDYERQVFMGRPENLRVENGVVVLELRADQAQGVGWTDRYGNVHVPLGKASFEPAALEENFRAVLDEIQRVKPASAKGRYLKKISVSSTMGPGIKIDQNRLRPDLEV